MPEEINRITSDHHDFLFVPTDLAMMNLKNEGLIEKSFLIGDIMVDSVLNNRDKVIDQSNVLKHLNLVDEDYYLATPHRPYNVDHNESLKNILKEFQKLDFKVVFPIHPRTKK